MKKENIRSVGWLNRQDGQIALTICFNGINQPSVAVVSREQYDAVKNDDEALKQLAWDSLSLNILDAEPARRPLTIGTRAEGLKIAKAKGAKVMKYCSGKYKWHGSASHYVGREEVVDREVLALWVERRTDRDGPYALVMCATLR
ncbi:DUF987 family protein [Vibrio fluvialis]|jgi:hypothetical protein|uniref:DUF987 family protein n=1 Tax=Vibrio fluvialis TaxID=676 RepID=UPI003D9BCC85|nr:hypothetical protein KKIDH5335_49080 [Vibrio fluvialis]